MTAALSSLVSMSTFSSGITVGIPFYAGEVPAHFRAAVDSVLQQSHPPDVIHLIQDGPVPDPLAEIVETYTGAHDAVQHIQIPANRGLSYALNTSIRATRTEYYARMDADDICHKERLERQLAFLDAHPTVDILGTAALEFSVDPDEPGTLLKRMPEHKEEIEKMAHYRTPFIHPSVVFRTRIFETIGLYAERDMVDDVALWMEALRHDVGVANLPDALLYFRTSGVVRRRATFRRALREAVIRLNYPTRSLRLNLLKLASILFRLLPARLQEWGYQNLR